MAEGDGLRYMENRCDYTGSASNLSSSDQLIKIILHHNEHKVQIHNQLHSFVFFVTFVVIFGLYFIFTEERC